MTPGAFGTRAGKARLRDTAAPTKLLGFDELSPNPVELSQTENRVKLNTTNLGRHSLTRHLAVFFKDSRPCLYFLQFLP